MTENKKLDSIIKVEISGVGVVIKKKKNSDNEKNKTSVK